MISEKDVEHVNQAFNDDIIFLDNSHSKLQRNFDTFCDKKIGNDCLILKSVRFNTLSKGT